MCQLRTITALKHDGGDVRAISIVIKILDRTIDLKEAIKNACNDYIKTSEGVKTYKYNCGYFNWADFSANVPNSICRKYGFEKMDDVVSDETVDWDELLVDEPTLSDEQIEKLKTELFMNGTEALEDFIGDTIDENWEKDTIDNMLDEIISQMPDSELLEFYIKYVTSEENETPQSFYDVSIAIDGRMNIRVTDVFTLEEAKEQALIKFGEADIGDVECVDFHAVNATDENGNLTDY